MGTRKWTHKVVKKQLGTNGRWFSHPTAATFDHYDLALVYANHFAAAQREMKVTGTRICVVQRNGDVVCDLAV